MFAVLKKCNKVLGGVITGLETSLKGYDICCEATEAATAR